LAIPYRLSYRLSYDIGKKELVFAGVMSENDKTELIGAAPNQSLFKKAVETLFVNSQTLRLKNTKAALFSYPKERGKDENFEVQLQLQKLLTEGNIKYHRSSDVAAVKVGTVASHEEKKYLFTLSDGVTKVRGSAGLVSLNGTATGMKLFDEVIEGNEVFMFGYPAAISYTNSFLDIRLPLLRKGIVAGKNDKLKIIILDCPTYQGNSGGLVIEVDGGSSGHKEFKGIGLITDFVPFIKEKSKDPANSGYSIAVPMDAIIELLKN
jgi:hypothetical protein